MLQNMWSVFIEKKDLFLGLLLEHLEISLLAIFIAILFGGIVGIIISEFQKSAKPTLGIINFLYTIPSISMLGFLIPFSGIGNATAVIALTVYALLPMVRSTHTGMTNIDPVILEAAKGMGSTRTQILFKVKMPLAMPVILSGVRNMVTMTIALAGVASFIGAGGLGVAIYRGITTNNAAMTMAGSLLIAILALLMDLILGFIEKRMKKHSVKAKKANRIMSITALLLCLAMIGGSMLPSSKQDTIQIATKPMTEQYVLGEMLDILIEQDTDLSVNLTQGIGGGTSNIQPAMESGEFDIYPEYTGTGWNMVLKKEGLYTEDLFDTLQSEYRNSYDMEWIGMYGFNNTYGLAVRREIAEKYDIHTYSDLKNISKQLIFGAEYDFFEREDGYDALCKTYGLEFEKTMDMDIGLKYQAIDQGKIDVMTIFTTDGQLSVSDVTTLEDDKGFYPSYLCGNVIRSEVLDKHPELKDIFNKLTGIISDDDMARMNYAVETEGKEPREAARAFLENAGLLK
ncbi:MAG: glycine betaine ABC transporter substrate-binding protein [Lachnospiraceae bacterium]|nr:glycine betaine ABC transporter substrate-binding protein [Lachnospiraceae bacterium]